MNLWKSFAQSIFYHQSEFDDEAAYKSLAERLDKIRSGTRHARQSAFLFRGLARAIRDDHQESESRRVEQGARRKLGARHCRKTVRHRSRLARANSIASCTARSRKSRLIGSIIFSAKKRRRTFWCCVSRTRFSSRSGIRVTSITSRSRPRKRSASKAAPVITKAPGALRDMVQNHLLQLLCLVAMEPPTDLGADSIRDEKVKVVRSLRHFTQEEVGEECRARAIRRGRDQRQTGRRLSRGRRRRSEIENRNVRRAARAASITGAGRTCRFYIRVGKRLPKSGTEISVHFKKAPHGSFQQGIEGAGPKRARHSHSAGRRNLAADAGENARATSFRIEPVKMDFHYGTSFGKASPEAYERLLLDAMSGDADAFRAARRSGTGVGFHRSDRGGVGRQRNAPKLYSYPAGSWGPEAADELLARDGRAWRRL